MTANCLLVSTPTPAWSWAVGGALIVVVLIGCCLAVLAAWRG